MSFLFGNIVYKWLNNALDMGITEERFWNMSIAELTREIDSRKRQERDAARETAAHNYILADLIGRSVARLYSSTAKMPTLADAYPSLFNSEEIEEQQQRKKDELTIMRFKQFAASHNKKYRGG